LEDSLNICNFSGFLVDYPKLQNVDGVSFLSFTLVVYTYRKTKSGEKNRIPTYIKLESWHTGAETIAKFATKGSKLTVTASAKNYDDGNIVFRVNEFDFCCLEDEE